MSKKINGISAQFYKLINYPPRVKVESVDELISRKKSTTSFFQRMRDSYKKIKK